MLNVIFDFSKLLPLFADRMCRGNFMIRLALLGVPLLIFGCKTRQFASKPTPETTLLYSCSNLVGGQDEIAPFEFMVFSDGVGNQSTKRVVISIVGRDPMGGRCGMHDDQRFTCRTNDGRLVASWANQDYSAEGPVRIKRKNLFGLVNERLFDVTCFPTENVERFGEE